MSNVDVVRLFAPGLLSKWGFNDGDVPDTYFDYLCEQYDDGWTLPPWINAAWHPTLIELVRTRLLPLLLEADVEVYEIDSSHNPIRAASIHGVEVDVYAENPDTMLPDVVAEVPFAEVWEIHKRKGTQE